MKKMKPDKDGAANDEKYKPDSLKYQWRIVGAVLRSSWATGLDKSIAFEIVDNYMAGPKNSRASLSYLCSATGSDRKAVIASVRRLVENGPFSVHRAGVGTRPTEYNIDFDSVQNNPSGGAGTTTSENISSGGVETTTGGGVETTTSDSSSGVGTTESVLQESPYKGGLLDRTIEPVSPAVGLAATLRTGGGFNELWKAYSHPHKRAEALAEYEQLSPDDDEHARMVDAARAWRERWEEQSNPDAPRYTLAKWIERREFDCAPPASYVPRKSKTTKPKQGESKVTSEKTAGTTSATVRDVQFHIEENSTYVAVELEGADGNTETEYFPIRGYDDGGAGLGRFNELCTAAGAPTFDESHFSILAFGESIEAHKREALGLIGACRPVPVDCVRGDVKVTRTADGLRFGDFGKKKAVNDNKPSVNFEDTYDDEQDRRQERGEGYGY